VLVLEIGCQGYKLALEHFLDFAFLMYEAFGEDGDSVPRRIRSFKSTRTKRHDLSLHSLIEIWKHGLRRSARPYLRTAWTRTGEAWKQVQNRLSHDGGDSLWTPWNSAIPFTRSTSDTIWLVI
jgi:hypothetical protein